MSIKNEQEPSGLFDKKYSGNRKSKQQRFNESVCLQLRPNELALKPNRIGFVSTGAAEQRDHDVVRAKTMDQTVDRVVSPVCRDGVVVRDYFFGLIDIEDVIVVDSSFSCSHRGPPRGW